MRYFPLIALAALTCGVTWSDDHKTPATGGGAPTAAQPGVSVAPVLRSNEPADDVVLTLPGPPAEVRAAVAPRVEPATIVHSAPPSADPDRPVLRRPKPDYPEGFESDAAGYLHGRLGVLTKSDARALLGEPSNSRPAYDSDQTVNGRIYAFADPTGHFRQIELDFDAGTGRLRTVFAYPLQMTWTDCLKAFGANVRATPANKGRTFYSYLNRRMDVLVGADGKVISLGMY
jgi:hypothetical protein